MPGMPRWLVSCTIHIPPALDWVASRPDASCYKGHVPLLCTVDSLSQRPALALEPVDECGPMGVQIPHPLHSLARVLVAGAFGMP
eukprot:785426-Pelagomonas_calceolata.AAC.1